MAAKTKVVAKKLTPAQEYNAKFRSTVAKLAKTRRKPITVDDVIAKVGTPPQGGKALGALMNAAAFDLGLVSVGLERSQQPSRRGALNRTWKLDPGYWEK